MLVDLHSTKLHTDLLILSVCENLYSSEQKVKGKEVVINYKLLPKCGQKQLSFESSVKKKIFLNPWQITATENSNHYHCSTDL